jgi:predicted HD superfamily hydrolase involved in NAD metabolism
VKNLYKHVENLLPPKRYTHTLGVVKTAIKLAKQYGIDENLAEQAALLHDISKCMTLEEMHTYIECDETLNYYGHLGELLHGFAGSAYAHEKLHINDEDILNALKYHTFGRRNMSMLEKIIYIADAIEPGRSYPCVEEIRMKVKKSLDEAILFEVNRKIRYLLEINSIIHPNTIEMRNSILENFN